MDRIFRALNIAARILGLGATLMTYCCASTPKPISQVPQASAQLVIRDARRTSAPQPFIEMSGTATIDSSGHIQPRFTARAGTPEAPETFVVVDAAFVNRTSDDLDLVTSCLEVVPRSGNKRRVWVFMASDDGLGVAGYLPSVGVLEITKTVWARQERAERLMFTIGPEAVDVTIRCGELQQTVTIPAAKKAPEKAPEAAPAEEANAEGVPKNLIDSSGTPISR